MKLIFISCHLYWFLTHAASSNPPYAMISKARHVMALPCILQKSLSASENEFLASCLKTCSSLQATEALLALLAWAWSLQDTHYAWLSGAESTRAFAAVMWPHWHYTQLSISYFVSHINRAEGCEAAWRSFDNWELYKFSNPQRRIGGCFFLSFFAIVYFLQSQKGIIEEVTNPLA